MTMRALIASCLVALCLGGCAPLLPDYVPVRFDNGPVFYHHPDIVPPPIELYWGTAPPLRPFEELGEVVCVTPADYRPDPGRHEELVRRRVEAAMAEGAAELGGDGTWFIVESAGGVYSGVVFRYVAMHRKPVGWCGTR